MGSEQSSDAEEPKKMELGHINKIGKNKRVSTSKPIREAITISDSSDDENIVEINIQPNRKKTNEKLSKPFNKSITLSDSNSDSDEIIEVKNKNNSKDSIKKIDEMLQEASKNMVISDSSDSDILIKSPMASKPISEATADLTVDEFDDSEDNSDIEIVELTSDDSEEKLAMPPDTPPKYKGNVYSEAVIDDGKTVTDYLFNQKNIPKVFVHYIEIQKLLRDLMPDNLNDTANEIISKAIELENHFEVFKMIHCFSKSRGKESLLFSQLLTKMIIAFGDNFKRIVVNNAQGNILYNLYENGVINLAEIKERMESFTDLVYFFLPEVGTEKMLSLKDSHHFTNIRKNINYMKANDWAVYKYMRKYGYEQNSVGLALRNDDVVLFKSLVKNNPKVMKEIVQIGQFDGDSTLMTPICAAAHYGSDDIFDFLLMQNVEIDAGQIKTCSIYGGSLHIVSALSRRGVDFSDMLRNASAEHRYDLFNYLIDSKADQNITFQSMINSENIAAFVYTMNTNHVLEFDADFIFRMAAIGGSLSVCLYLAEHGLANPNFKRGKEQKTLLISSSENGRNEIVSFLLRIENIDIHAKDRKGMTALHHACLKCHPECVKTLIEGGANLEARDDIGETPLIKAAISGSIECAQLLISRNADIDGQSNYRMTPLLAAAREQHVPMCEFLLTKGADITISSKSAISVLHYAANNLKLLKLFIMHGADVNAAMHDGKRAIDWCETPECEKFLIRNGALPKLTPH